MSKFNVNESEKNRIRGLHKNHSIINEQDMDSGIKPVEVDPSSLLDDRPKLQDVKPTKSKPKQAAGCNDPDWVNLPMGGTQGQPNYNGGKNNYCDRCAANNTGPNFPVIFINGTFHYDLANGFNYCSCCTPQTQTENCVCCNGQNQVGMPTPVPIGGCPTYNFGAQYTNCVSGTGPMPNCGQQSITHYCVDCPQQIMSSYIVPGSCPQGMLDMGTNPNPTPGPCWNCVNLTQCQQGWVGENTQADCQQNCQPPTQVECVNGNCVSDPNGQFANMTACQNSGCGQGSYDCINWADPNGCQQVSGSGGQFATLDDCLTSPCQCDDIIQTWPLYLNNPNNPSGNWNGSPHDGPSNPNALQNQLNNVQNSNAYNGNNPVQLHKAKCKEAAINFWLSNSTNIACCADSNFAVGYASADPLGCVTSNFINMIDGNFMNNHAGWPSQGCNWLNNALARAQSQQAQYGPTSGAYCKLQGKINFLNNFISTAQSTYINGTPVFTPGC